jgi:hypothetical protein
MDDNSYREIFIRAEKLDIRTSDGKGLSLEEFCGLGRA